MKCGTFYILPLKKNQHNTKFDYIEILVFNLTYKYWRIGKKILITCENKNQAYRIDKILWECNPDTFLPHNLFNNKKFNIPVVIYWEQCYYDNKPRDLLINLMQKNLNFFFNFYEIIDFVPATNNLKKMARNRYKSYRNNGFMLSVTK